MALLTGLLRGVAGTRLLRALALATALTLLPASNLRAAPASPVVQEYQVKALFLFNFLQFVEWPEGAFPSPDAPVTIGILGDDPFGPVLDETLRAETVRNRPLVIVRSSRLEDLKNCHLLFIGKSERNRLAAHFSQLEGAPALTVGDTEGFASRGGIINFYLDGKKLRFEINPDAAQRAGLKLSSQLLSLGKIVGPEGAKEDR